MRSLRLRAVVACILFVWAPVDAGTAHAGGRDAVTADALFREGRRAADDGNYVVACAKFEQSNRLDPAPGTLLNLADCEENRKQLGQALLHYRKLVEQLPASDPRKSLADSRALALERRMPMLRIVLSSDDSATVRRDGEVLNPAALGAMIAVDPGQHLVVVSSPGRRDRRYQVPIGEGEAKQLDVHPGDPLRSEPLGGSAGSIVAQPGATPAGPTGSIGAQPGAPPAAAAPIALAPVPAPLDRGASRRGVSIVLGTAGIASLATGAVFGMSALTRLSSANARCQGHVCSSQSAIDDYREAQTFAHVADATLGVGVVCVATAIVLALTGHPDAIQGAGDGPPRLVGGRF